MEFCLFLCVCIIVHFLIDNIGSYDEICSKQKYNDDDNFGIMFMNTIIFPWDECLYIDFFAIRTS